MTVDIGDTVKVKKGVKCPDDASISIGGWQGRIISIEENLIGIQWDSITIGAMPRKFMMESEREGLAWAEMILSAEEIELAVSRDREADAERIIDELENKYRWLDGSDEGERIFTVIAEVDADDEEDAWITYLQRTLTFPFSAKITEYHGRGRLAAGDELRVQGLDEADDRHGILVHVAFKKEHFVFLLRNLTVLDKMSPNYTPIKDYRVWFANR